MNGRDNFELMSQAPGTICSNQIAGFVDSFPAELNIFRLEPSDVFVSCTISAIRMILHMMFLQRSIQMEH